MIKAAARNRYRRAELRTHLDLPAIVLVLVASNLHLIGLGSPRSLVFIPEGVLAGQWWRLLTHPFVHVSLYHLVLDAGAFLLLYRSIDYRAVPARAAGAAMCAVFGAAAAGLSTASINSLGLCGLSATAHGLMALTALQQIDKGRNTAAAAVSLSLVVCKSVIEAVAGKVLFDFMHMGMCGTPLAACHLGGVCGGTLAFLAGKAGGRVRQAFRF